MKQLFNAQHCSHPIPWKDPETLVIRMHWGKAQPQRWTHACCFFFKELTFELLAGKLPAVRQKESKPKTHLKGKCSNRYDVSVPVLALGLRVCVCGWEGGGECFSQCCFSTLMGIFMVKPSTKGNLSQNATPQETVKIKHGGPGPNHVSLWERAFWSVISRPLRAKGVYINHPQSAPCIITVICQVTHWSISMHVDVKVICNRHNRG